MLRPMILRRFFHLLTALTATVTGGAQAQELTRIARPGDHLGAVPTYSSGETWFGLYKLPTGFALRSTTVSVAEVANDCGGVATRLRAATSQQPLFLLNGPGLRDGPVRAVLGEMELIYPGQSRSVELTPNHWYYLQAYGTASPGVGDTWFTEYLLVLGHLQIRDTLSVPNRFGLGAFPHVVWAGDIDSDGALDLILGLSTHYAGRKFGLYLSRSAQPPGLVAHVSTWEEGGC